MPRNTVSILIVFVISFFFFILVKLPVYSQSVSDLEKEISEKTQAIQEKTSVLGVIEKRITEIKGSNNSLAQKIALITEEVNKLQESINETESQISAKLEEIERKQKEVEEKKETIDKILGELYMESRNRIPRFFLSSWNWDALVQNFYVRKNSVSLLKAEIEKINGEFSSLADAKSLLDKEKESLDSQKKDLDDSMTILNQEKAKLQAELNKQIVQKSGLSAEITDLNKKVSQLQSALIAARTAGLVYTGSDASGGVGTAIAQAPAGHFGVFSIGAYTHRNGMSQWGAKARSEAGQSSAQILSFYYPGSRISTGLVNVGYGQEPLTVNISVDGYGTLPFEDYYLMGIKEMPESWSLEALKAQAIAARTFAVRHTQNGRRSICTTQSCQVFGTPLKTGAWRTAVLQTRGQILVDGSGAPMSTQYAAVHGGWVNNVGYDTQSGGGGNWFNDAWEKASGVSWFYKSWYRAGYRPDPQGENCGHSPWLSPSEMMIMVNGYLVKNDIGLRSTPDKSRLLPSDYGVCPGRVDYGRADKVPYSLQELQSFLSSPVTSISSVQTTLVNGSTTQVHFYTNRGIVTIPGFGFKDIYNQLAPGHMRIQQQSSYAYFNIEKK